MTSFINLAFTSTYADSPVLSKIADVDKGTRRPAFMACR
jgi:hypothetical protein